MVEQSEVSITNVCHFISKHYFYCFLLSSTSNLFFISFTVDFKAMEPSSTEPLGIYRGGPSCILDIKLKTIQNLLSWYSFHIILLRPHSPVASHWLQPEPQLLTLSMSSTLEVLIMQNRVSVKEDGVVFIEERVCTLLGWLIGGVHATSA